MATDSQAKEFKVLLIGDVRVGKTSFLTRFTRNVVNKAEKPTVGVEYMPKNLVLKDGTIAKVKLWDTAGSEKYLALTTAHYRGSQGAMLFFFDLTDRSTFEHVNFWLSAIEDHAEKDTTVMLVGNKYDLVKDNPNDRQVTTKEAEEFAKKSGLYYSETSAKTGHNVKEAFEDFIETIYASQKKKGSKDTQRQHEEDKLKLRLKKNFGRPEGTQSHQAAKQDTCCS